jgi:hypothetical protein
VPLRALRRAVRRALPLLLVAACANADGPDERSRWLPDATFAQLGGNSAADNWTAGVQWEWRRTWHWGASVHATGRWELAAGRWSALQSWHNDERDWFTQVAFSPVLRLSDDRLPGWYLDAGIGPTLLLPTYVDRERTFSTQFNFQTQLAGGRVFGAHGQHDLALFFAHVSNAETEQPNPGLNLYALRYTWRFGGR